jgi:hypothetical protein
VSTSERTRPSEWAIDRFGEHVAGELWHRVPMALAAAIRRAMDTQEASQMHTLHAFGSARWGLVYEELVNHLRTVPGAIPIRAPRAFYQLVIVGGDVLLPWHYAKTTGLDMREVRPGRSFGVLARSVLATFGPPSHWQQPALPLMPADEEDERDIARISEVLAELDFRPRTLIVGYSCNPRQGLLRVGWGDAALAPDGAFDWHHYDELPIPPARVPRPRSGE